MTKQQEIREEIAVRFALEKYGGTKEELYPHWLEVARVEADEILSYLNDNGVVLKVDRELPEKEWEQWGLLHNTDITVKMGFFEPLIDGESK